MENKSMENKKTERVANYVDKIGSFMLSASIVSEVLESAVRDRIGVLIFTTNEFDCMRRYMVYCGQWNWDMKTFMGIKLEIRD